MWIVAAGACEQSQNLGKEPAPCPPDLVPCGGECVDLRSDPRHCGGCLAACVPGQVCGPDPSNVANLVVGPSTCQAACPPGSDGYPATDCGGSCVYWGGNSAHCGGCSACPTGTYCVGGYCDTCPIGVEFCVANGPTAGAVLCLTEVGLEQYCDPAVALETSSP
jgi:hypothetical protein